MFFFVFVLDARSAMRAFEAGAWRRYLVLRPESQMACAGANLLFRLMFE